MTDEELGRKWAASFGVMPRDLYDGEATRAEFSYWTVTSGFDRCGLPKFINDMFRMTSCPTEASAYASLGRTLRELKAVFEAFPDDRGEK